MPRLSGADPNCFRKSASQTKNIWGKMWTPSPFMGVVPVPGNLIERLPDRASRSPVRERSSTLRCKDGFQREDVVGEGSRLRARREPRFGQQVDTARRAEGCEATEDGRTRRKPNLPRARVGGGPLQDRQHDVSGRARSNPGPSCFASGVVGDFSACELRAKFSRKVRKVGVVSG